MSKAINMLPGLMLVIAQAALAQSGAEVASTLVVKRIAVNAQGKEVAEQAGSAKPGEVLEYVADYANRGKTTAKHLEATLPIPAGTEYLPNSAKPAPSLASADGSTFSPIPLMHKVKRADGTLVEQPLPYTEYRFLRWPAQDLGAGKNLLVSTRVKVVADAAPGAALAKK